MHLEISSPKSQPFCPGWDDLAHWVRSEQNGWHFEDDIFKCTFENETYCILIIFSLKFVPDGAVDNKSSFVQLMAWCRIGNKPLSEPMMTQLTNSLCLHFATMSYWNQSMYCMEDVGSRVSVVFVSEQHYDVRFLFKQHLLYLGVSCFQ